MKRRTTKTQRLPDLRQGALLEVAPSTKGGEVSAPKAVVFEEGDSERLYVGNVPLRKFLEDGPERWVLRLGDLLGGMDWARFEAAYQPGGRPPLHPRRVVGLMMYAMVQQQSSLRQMESLARRDVGAWWLAGGLTPDHTTLARFVGRHEALLSTEFFVSLTARIARQLGIKPADLAIDGTVTLAAASAVSALKREALEKVSAAATEALAAAEASGAEPPALARAQANVEVLEKAHRVLEEREEANKAAGKPIDKIQVSPVEPEALVQPLKRSSDYGLAYKPVVGAHSSGLVVAQNLSSSSETEHVQDLFAQHQAVFGEPAKRALLDSAFCNIALLTTCVAMGLDVLCPTGQNGKPRRGRKGLFGKDLFTYVEASDRVVCPSSAELTPGPVLKDRRGLEYREFRTRACASCPLRTDCTGSKQRVYKRYVGDELKDAMTALLRHPEARAAYARRSVIVEPVFARLAAAGFTRFKRRGRVRARTELALRCSAQNIALFVRRTRSGFFAICLIRRPDSSWRLTVISVNAPT